jgi:SSS family solute:Na+ symporter
MIVGTSLAVIFNIVQPFWTNLQPLFVRWAGDGRLGRYLVAHPYKCPVNGMWFSTITALLALAAYITVSLLTCKDDYDMDRMLHRGKYAVAEEGQDAPKMKKPNAGWGRLIGIDEHYSRGDRILAIGTFWYQMAWKPVTLSIILWWFLVGHQSDQWWFKYSIICGIWFPIPIAVVTTVWLTIGTIRDLIDMFRTLRTAGRNDADDGSVRGHQNAGDAFRDAQETEASQAK